MKTGVRLIGKLKTILFIMLMALLATLVMPISVHADEHGLNFYVAPIGSGLTSPSNTWITVSSDSGALTAISVTPNDGYTFYKWHINWTDGLADQEFYTPSATVGCSHATEAHAFLINNSSTGIDVRSADTSMGNATGSRAWSWAVDGQWFTINAIPHDLNYEFDYWEKNGTRIDSGATVEVQMPKIDFDTWSDTGNVQNSQDKYVAHFKSKSGEHGFRAVVGSEGGNITGQPYLSYDSWKTAGNVNVTATPEAGYDFVKWVAPDGSDYSTNKAITVPYPRPEPSDDDKKNDIVYTALFMPHDSKGISAEARLDSETGNIGGGSVSPSYVEWSDNNKNQAISFTANPDKNMKFVKWVVPDNLAVKSSLNNPNLSVVMPASKPDDNITITAVFAADEKHEVYFDVLGVGEDGKYSSGIGGTVSPPMITPDENNDSNVNVQATPWDGYEFEKWELEDSKDSSYVVLPTDLTQSSIAVTVKKQSDIPHDVHIKAYFKKTNHKGYWTYAVEGGDTSPRFTKWQSGGGSFNIVATPNPGYVFDHWDKYNCATGEISKNISKAATYSVIIDTEEPKDKIIYYAYFKKESGYGIYSYGIQGGDTSPRFTKWSDATKGTSVTLSATPYDGYVFDHWRYYNKETGETLENYSKLSAISVKMPIEEMNESRYYYAVFKPVGDLGIYTEAADNVGGATSPKFTQWTEQNKGTSITVSATPEQGYVFDHWRYFNRETGETIENYSRVATISVLMPKEINDNIYLYAVFRQENKFGIYSFGIEGGETTPKFTQWTAQNKGTSFNLVATPNEGYEFNHWRLYNKATGETIENYSSNSTISVKMPDAEPTDNIYYFAVFNKETNYGIYSYGIQGGDTSPRFTKWSDATKGTSVTLSATPDDGYVFDHWRYYNAETEQTIENYSSLAAISVKMPTDKMQNNRYYYAVFRKIGDVGIYSYGIEGGDTSPRFTKWSDATKGTSIQLTATADKDYEFDHWRYFNKETGVVIENYSSLPSLSVVMPNEISDSRYYFAIFKKKDVKGIYSYGVEGGDTSPRFTQWTEETKSKSIQLQATADEGYEFDHWRYFNAQTKEEIENYSTLPSVSVIMPGTELTDNIYYYAVFKKANNYGIYSYGIQGGDTSPRFTKWSDATKGTSVTLSATPDDGYVFDHWRYYNAETEQTIENYSSLAAISVKMPTDKMQNNRYYYAVFRKIGDVGIYSYGIEGGDTSPRFTKWSDATKGTSIQLTATADKDYEFDHWRYYNKETGVVIENYSSLPSLSVVMPNEISDSRYYFAIFKKKNVKGIYSYGVEGGDTSPRFTQWTEETKSKSIQLQATADEGYEFDHWRYFNAQTKEEIENYSTLPSISVIMPGTELTDNIYYYAVFKKANNYGIYSYGIQGGDTNPRFTKWSEQTKGTSISLTATAEDDYVFDHWRYFNAQTLESIENYSSLETISVKVPNDKMSANIYYYAVFRKTGDMGIYSYGIQGGDTNPRYTKWSPQTKGTSLTLTATPSDGYEFDYWRYYNKETGVTIEKYSDQSSISVVMPNEMTDSHYYYAVFKKKDAIGIYAMGIEGGEASPDFTPWDETTKDKSFQLQASPAEGYEFDHWRFYNDETGETIENYSTVSSISVKMPGEKPSANRYYFAVFRKASETGIYSYGIEGGDTSPRYVKWSDQTKGTSITLTATPSKGYEFDHWRFFNKETGASIENYSKDASISVKMPEKRLSDNIYYYAVFKKNNEKEKNKEIHVEGKETGIAQESYLDKWRSWIDPALKYVRSTVGGMAHAHTVEDVSVYEGNKNRGYDSSKSAADLKSEIIVDNQLKHSQSVDHPIIPDDGAFSISELSGIKTVFVEGSGAKSETDAIKAANEKYGDLYKSEVVLAGDIHFEAENGDQIVGQPSKDSIDATVVINGINTEDTDIWMLLYKDLAGSEFVITPISDAASLLRFTLPDQFGGKITLLSIKYN